MRAAPGSRWMGTGSRRTRSASRPRAIPVQNSPWVTPRSGWARRRHWGRLRDFRSHRSRATRSLRPGAAFARRSMDGAPCTRLHGGGQRSAVVRAGRRDPRAIRLSPLAGASAPGLKVLHLAR